MKEVDEFVVASHLHWALWGLLSVRVHYLSHTQVPSAFARDNADVISFGLCIVYMERMIFLGRNPQGLFAYVVPGFII